MTKNSVDHPDDHEAKIASSTELALERVATLADIENRQPDSKEIWYGHSILTSTLFPATPPAEGTPFVSKDNNTVEYILEAGIDSLTRSRDYPYGKYPRLLMAWMAKQIRSAGTRKTPTVDPAQHTITIQACTSYPKNSVSPAEANPRNVCRNSCADFCSVISASGRRRGLQATVTGSIP